MMHLIQQLGLQRCKNSNYRFEKWQFKQDYSEIRQRELLKFGEHPTASDRGNPALKTIVLVAWAASHKFTQLF